MKQIVSFFLIFLISTSTTIAYSPTAQDSVLISSVYKKLAGYVKKESTRTVLFLSFQELQRKYANNERISHLIRVLVKKINEDGIDGEYMVTSVVDGDTIKVKINGIVQTVRILGIDTPEKFTTRTGHEECYGKEASEYASSVMTGKKIRIEGDATQDTRDKYGRILAHVFLENGAYYEEAAIRNGYGFRYVYRKPTKYDNSLLRAEQNAKLENVGVWTKCEGKRIPVKEIIWSTTDQIHPILSNSGSSIPPENPIGNFSCSIIKTTCGNMISCEEAVFYAYSCGVSWMDGDRDGRVCESICR